MRKARVTITGSWSIREWFPHRGGVVIVMDVLWRQLHRYLRNWWLDGSLVTHNEQQQEHTKEQVQWRPLELRHELPGSLAYGINVKTPSLYPCLEYLEYVSRAIVLWIGVLKVQQDTLDSLIGPHG